MENLDDFRLYEDCQCLQTNKAYYYRIDFHERPERSGDRTQGARSPRLQKNPSGNPEGLLKAGDGNRTHVSSLEGWRTSHCTTPAYTSPYDARARDGDRTRDPLLGKEVLHR